jgi:hypothetical protein
MTRQQRVWLIETVDVASIESVQRRCRGPSLESRLAV